MSTYFVSIIKNKKIALATGIVYMIAMFSSIDTYYKVEENKLTQIVELSNDSTFPVVADPTTTSRPENVLVETYDDSFKISHTAINTGTWTTTGLIAFFGEKIEKGIINCFGETVG